MRRIKKKVFLGMYVFVVAFLALVKACSDSIGRTTEEARESAIPDSSAAVQKEVRTEDMAKHDEHEPRRESESEHKSLPVVRKPHRILGVVSYERSFPDVEDVHMDAALFWGIKPIENRDSAENSKSGLVYVGADPFYIVDKRMTSSIPYLVPRAHDLLHEIGRNFMDSLTLKGIPLHRLIVSSVLRTEEDVMRLRRTNVNASPRSCHRYGTTFDICYNRYDPVGRLVRDDTLKWVLSEVLRDERKAGRCYIKYEVKQGCFHITCR